MGIQFYNGLGSFGYNNYHREIPQVTPEEVKKQDNANEVVEPKTPETLSPETISKLDQRTKAASLEDVSLTFNKEDDFSYLGSESDIKTLDMQKAISDMQKDSMLQQYQYFVGDSKNLFDGGADGLVIAK